MKKIISLVAVIFLSSCSIFSNSEIVKDFPTYGNYCSSNFLQKTTLVIPIDMTDFSCQEHNLCYANKGYSRARCDAKMIENLSRIIPQNKLEESVQKLIISYLKRS